MSIYHIPADSIVFLGPSPPGNMSMGYQDPLPGSTFEDLGRVPIKYVNQEELDQNFLTYEENQLQPLKPMQPAAVLRLKDKNKKPSWVSWPSWDVNTKSQEIIMNENEKSGFIDETDKGTNVKLKKFVASNRELEATFGEDPISEEDMFQGKLKQSIPYVNDIPLDRSMVIDGDMWTLFGNLGLEKLGNVCGVSTPWGYAGTRGSAFPVHVEDSNLGSINILKEGSSKIWWIIHPENRLRFILGLKKLYPNEYEMCEQYHQHKTLWINPVFVQYEMNIPVFCIKQLPGDLVVTWPGSFHWGFNTGNNASMAVNYCPKGDFESETIIKTAKICCPSCPAPTIVLPVAQLFEKTPKAFLCNKCPKGFTAPMNLIKHKRKVHNEKVEIGDIDPVECPVKSCKKKVMKLDNHLRTHQILGGSCKLCGQEVMDKKAHWANGCRECQFCKMFGRKRIFYEMKDAWGHKH